ncbi:MAG: hypothetical protein IK020_04610 [Clostridiales bacterium]|nr:hypothetical protein [Clostridiales bacterium]
MNSGFLKGSNIFSVIALIILPFIFLLASIENLLHYFGNSIFGLGFLLLYFFLTTVGYWGHMIQGIRSIGNGKKKTLISAAVFQILMLIMYMIASGYLCYRFRNSSSAFWPGMMKVFLFLFAAFLLLAVIRIHMARKCPDESMASTASKGAAKKVFMLCVVIPGGCIAFLVIMTKLLHDNPVLLKVITAIAAILMGLFYLVGALLLITVLSAPFMALGAGAAGVAGAASSFASKVPARKSSGDDANAEKKQKLLKQKNYFQQAWDACERSNWDTLTCVNYGVSGKESGRKHFRNEIDKIDAKLKKLK